MTATIWRPQSSVRARAMVVARQFAPAALSYAKDQQKTDIQTVGMEFSYILTQVRKAAETIDAGSIEEVTIRTDSMTLIIRVLSRDYFVARSSGFLATSVATPLSSA